MDVKNLRGQQVRVELEDGSVRFVTVVTRARSGFWVVEGKTLPKRYARPDGTRRTTVHQNRITDADGRELFPPAADAVREDSQKTVVRHSREGVVVFSLRADSAEGPGAALMITEQEIKDLTDAVSNDVDEWVRAGAGTYDELEAVVEKAIRRIAQREGGP